MLTRAIALSAVLFSSGVSASLVSLPSLQGSIVQSVYFNDGNGSGNTYSGHNGAFDHDVTTSTGVIPAYTPGQPVNFSTTGTSTGGAISYDKPAVSSSSSSGVGNGQQSNSGTASTLIYSAMLTSNSLTSGVLVRVTPQAIFSLTGGSSNANSNYGAEVVMDLELSNNLGIIENHYNGHYAISYSWPGGILAISDDAFNAFTFLMMPNVVYTVGMYTLAATYSSEGGYASAQAYLDPFFELVDPTTPDATFLFSDGITNVAPTGSVPEPASLCLVSLGLLGIARSLRRRLQ